MEAFQKADPRPLLRLTAVKGCNRVHSGGCKEVTWMTIGPEPVRHPKVCVCVAQTHISDNHGQYVWPHTSWAPSKASCRKMSDHTHAEARAKMAWPFKSQSSPGITRACGSSPNWMQRRSSLWAPRRPSCVVLSSQHSPADPGFRGTRSSCNSEALLQEKKCKITDIKLGKCMSFRKSKGMATHYKFLEVGKH